MHVGLAGSARRGAEYQLLGGGPTIVVIPAGADSVQLTVAPNLNAFRGRAHNVILRVLVDPARRNKAYVPGPASTAIVAIQGR